MSVCRCLGPAELGEGFCGVVSLGGDNRDCFSLPAACLDGASPSASVRSMAAAAACRRRAAGCLPWPDAAAVEAPAGPSFPAASLPGVPRAAVAAGAALLSSAAGAGSSSPAASPLGVALPSSRSLPSPSSSNSKSMSETSAVSSSTSSYMSRLTCTQSNTASDYSLMLRRGWNGDICALLSPACSHMCTLVRTCRQVQRRKQSHLKSVSRNPKNKRKHVASPH